MLRRWMMLLALATTTATFWICPLGARNLYHQPRPSSHGDCNLIRACGELPLPAAFSPATGAGSPRPELLPSELPGLLMAALERNDFPEVDAGLESMWAFAGDTTRFIFRNNKTAFFESAHETAKEYPTSFYGMAMNGQSWELEASLNMVGGNTDACWIATQLMKTVSRDGRSRRWQWELRKHRRPPLLGAWYVESIGSSDRLGNFEVHD